jgi:hypothetical protein
MQAHATRLEGQLRISTRRSSTNAASIATYQRERDELRERLVMTADRRDETTIAEGELDALLSFAEHALTHASAMWTAAASTNERVRMQTTLFPDGLTWKPGKMRKQAGKQRAVRPFRMGTRLSTVTGILVEPQNFLPFYQLEKLSAKHSERGITRKADGTAWAQLLRGLRSIRAAFPAAA